MSEPFIGEVRIVALNFAPRGWAMCDGAQLPIAQNTALFSILGTTYGGDGRTTFNLPNLMGRVPIHAGTGPGLPPRTLGQHGGSAYVTLGTAQLPSHRHAMQSSADPAHTGAPKGAMPAPIEGAPDIYSHSRTNTVAFDARAVKETGSGGAHENRQPALGVNFMIALLGLFPSRN